MRRYNPYNSKKPKSSFINNLADYRLDFTESYVSKYRAEEAEKYPTVNLSPLAREWLHQKQI